MIPLILASESPRRRELLGRLGYSFSVRSAAVDELRTHSDIMALPMANAELKAAAVSCLEPDSLVLGSDTVVIFDGQVIGKPRDLADARAILRRLSGQTHAVVTGVALLHAKGGFRRIWSVVTHVKFRAYDESVIDRYLAEVPVLDKAGAYAIQQHGEWLVDSIDGEFENVIGLPLIRLKAELQSYLGAAIPRRRLLISAGPTRERLDPVRFLSNRSTGKMGYALAEAGVISGFDVVLVSGPVALPVPAGVRCIAVESAAEMAAAIHAEAPLADMIIMAAAVADYRPKEVCDHKLKKTNGDLTITLERTEDILATLGRDKRLGQILIGFAAETDDLLSNAAAKLQKKNLDWIAANDVSRFDIGFGSDNNAITLLGKNGERHDFDPAPKKALALSLLSFLMERK